ncbi:MAG: hypothetical protein ACK5P7_01570 [Bdellovibrio sp.]|jgi:hypothetical protein
MTWKKLTLLMMTVLGITLGVIGAQAQATYNDRDPNLDNFDGQYIDNYATPKSNPQYAQIIKEKPGKEPECLECRRSPVGIFEDSNRLAPGSAPAAPSGTGRAGGFEQGP